MWWETNPDIFNWIIFPPHLSLTPVVPKLFWCADHLKYFSAPRSTKCWFTLWIGGPLELIMRTTSGPRSRLWESLPYTNLSEKRRVWHLKILAPSVEKDFFIQVRKLWKVERILVFKKKLLAKFFLKMFKKIA